MGESRNYLTMELKCRAMAERAGDPRVREGFVRAADSWRRLQELQERQAAAPRRLCPAWPPRP